MGLYFKLSISHNALHLSEITDMTTIFKRIVFSILTTNSIDSDSPFYICKNNLSNLHQFVRLFEV